MSEPIATFKAMGKQHSPLACRRTAFCAAFVGLGAFSANSASACLCKDESYLWVIPSDDWSLDSPGVVTDSSAYRGSWTAGDLRVAAFQEDPHFRIQAVLLTQGCVSEVQGLKSSASLGVPWGTPLSIGKLIFSLL